VGIYLHIENMLDDPFAHMRIHRQIH